MKETVHQLTEAEKGFEIPSLEMDTTVLLKCKLPLLVLFRLRHALFLSRQVSFLSRSVWFLSRITEAFSLEYVIHVYTRKMLTTVSFHTGSRGVLSDGIRFQQTCNKIACLQFGHIQLFESTSRYNCTEIRSNRTRLIPVVSELHTMKFLIKHLHYIN